MKRNKSKKGFTLIEILVVIALIAILATITVLALNPAARFRQARNTQRKTDVASIASAITLFLSDETSSNTLTDLGAIPLCDDGNAQTPDVPAIIGKTTTGVAVDLAGTTPNDKLVNKYLGALPKDPTGGANEDNTGYTICAEGNDRVRIAAPRAEQETIFVVR